MTKAQFVTFLSISKERMFFTVSEHTHAIDLLLDFSENKLLKTTDKVGKINIQYDMTFS